MRADLEHKMQSWTQSSWRYYKDEFTIDIGVHKDLDIEQEEYCFDICFQEDGASLLL